MAEVGIGLKGLGLAAVVILGAGGAGATELNALKADLSVQYRVMYNNSTIGAADGYDFFRQRMRISLDVHPSERSGGLVQLEYRGGFGGSSPGADDPRGVGPGLGSVAFNRLSPRGIRYGYLYAVPFEGHKVMGGILPLSDRLGDTLFSADWDFNVGGIAADGKAFGADYRLGYLRLIEDLSGGTTPGRSGHFYVADAGFGGPARLGAHAYYMTAPTTAASARFEQAWYGMSGSYGALNGFVMVNSGKSAGLSNSGAAAKLEARFEPAEKLRVSVMGLGSTGRNDKPVAGFGNEEQAGFFTPQGMLGTAGYWGYTYVFSPHGPSDVNDFGLEVGNRGFGLVTAQARVEADLADGLSGQVVAGLFRSARAVGASGKNIGTEVGAQLGWSLAEYQKLEFGAGFAFLGDAGLAQYQGAGNKKDVVESFARWQLEF